MHQASFDPRHRGCPHRRIGPQVVSGGGGEWRRLPGDGTARSDQRAGLHCQTRQPSLRVTRQRTASRSCTIIEATTYAPTRRLAGHPTVLFNYRRVITPILHQISLLSAAPYRRHIAPSRPVARRPRGPTRPNCLPTIAALASRPSLSSATPTAPLSYLWPRFGGTYCGPQFTALAAERALISSSVARHASSAATMRARGKCEPMKTSSCRRSPHSPS